MSTRTNASAIRTRPRRRSRIRVRFIPGPWCSSVILRVDRQDLSEAFKHPLIIPLDLTKFAKLLKGYAVARKSREHLSDIAFGLVQQASLHENPRLLKQRAGISWIGFHNPIEDIGCF